MKAMENKLTIYGLRDNIAYSEAMGLSKCFERYANLDCSYILEIGFNSFSGYVYIALEEGITICSFMGRDCQYLVTDIDNGEEFFFDTMEEAENKLISLTI